MRKANKLKFGWKIMRSCDRPGVLKTLYKGLRGTRYLPMNQWLVAERKWGTESGRTYYWTGFHILERLEDMASYLRKFSTWQGKLIVPCVFEPAEMKPTNARVHLAQRMLLLDREHQPALDVCRKVGATSVLQDLEADVKSRLVLDLW